MKRSFPFLLCLFLLIARPGVVIATPSLQAQPKDAPLSQKQIEQLLGIKFEDIVLAREIKQRGVAFRVDTQKLEQLQRRGLGPQAKQALLQQAEQQAYAAYMAETGDAAKRLALGQEFLRLYPDSEHLTKVQAELRELELAAFKTNFQN